MKSKKLVNWMKERHERSKTKREGNETFTLVYDKEDETTDVFILGDMRIGTITCDEFEKMEIVGAELKRVSKKDLTILQEDRFIGSSSEKLTFDIMLAINVFINDDVIEPRKSGSYVFDPECFLNMEYDRDAVTKESY